MTQDGPPEDERTIIQEPEIVLISPQRIIVLAVVTQGLYVFYWFYLTWRQLVRETREAHFPVWHALALLVPVYGLFRAHKHLSLIAGLSTGIGGSPLSPATGIVMLLVSNVCGGASIQIDDQVLLLVLGVLSTALVTVVMASYQEELNAVWVSKLGNVPSRQAPTAGEAVLIGVGLLFWVSILLSSFREL